MIRVSLLLGRDLLVVVGHVNVDQLAGPTHTGRPEGQPCRRSVVQQHDQDDQGDRYSK
jgi:hypothetical protein